jgi:hypothetical protein
LLTKIKGNVEAYDTENTTAKQPGNPLQMIEMLTEI